MVKTIFSSLIASLIAVLSFGQIGYGKISSLQKHGFNGAIDTVETTYYYNVNDTISIEGEQIEDIHTDIYNEKGNLIKTIWRSYPFFENSGMIWSYRYHKKKRLIETFFSSYVTEPILESSEQFNRKGNIQKITYSDRSIISGSCIITRDKNGNIIKSHNYDTTGKSTGYIQIENNSFGILKSSSYSKDNILLSYRLWTYDSHGNTISKRAYNNKNVKTRESRYSIIRDDQENIIKQIIIGDDGTIDVEINRIAYTKKP